MTPFKVAAPAVTLSELSSAIGRQVAPAVLKHKTADPRLYFGFCVPGLRRYGGRTAQIKVVCAGESRGIEEDCGYPGNRA